MSLGNQMFKGVIWSSVERISVQALSFVLGIILARLLTPTEYGTIGLLVVFISFSQVFIDSGFTKALIQKVNRTDDDISTVFIFNLIIALICYIILFFTAPVIASFYELNELEGLLKVLALSLILNATFAVPQTLLTIELDFKVLAKVNLIGTLVSGVIAILLAYIGYGAWALVAQTILKSVVTAVLIWIQTKWKPVVYFSKTSFKSLWNYGSKILVSSLLNNVVNNFYALFIAKLISTKDLGYYTRGTQFADTFYSSISSVFDSVLLPVLSRVQEDRDTLVRHTQTIIRSAALLVIPLFLGLSILAEPMITVLLTEKWLPAVPIMQILCIARLITIISGININLLYVIGRTDLALRQQYVKIAIRVILLIAALPFGIIYIAWAELLATTLHFFINTYYPGKIMKYGALRQIKDLSPIILAGIIMVSIIFLVKHYIITNDVVTLLLNPIIGILIYGSVLYYLKIEEVSMLWTRIKEFLTNRK